MGHQQPGYWHSSTQEIFFNLFLISSSTFSLFSLSRTSLIKNFILFIKHWIFLFWLYFPSCWFYSNLWIISWYFPSIKFLILIIFLIPKNSYFFFECDLDIIVIKMQYLFFLTLLWISCSLFFYISSDPCPNFSLLFVCSFV